jgi:arylsulfatase A-like enzyme
MWAKDVPKFSVLWMSDPDYTQHDSGPGSPAALGALESVDRDLALLLKTLDERKLRDKTDIFVVSDHGFSTVGRHVDVTGVLRQAGFKASKMFKAPQPGDVLVDSLGGSVALYVVGHDEATIRRLAEFLQASDYAGVLFSRVPVEGAFLLSQVHTATANAPDLLVSMRWSAGTNRFGAPGMLVADTTKIGMHGSLSPFDMHNTLVAAGPDFRQGLSDEFPSGNVDLAPTILWILGIPAPQPMDGRILAEAMIGAAAAPHSEQKTIEASRDNGATHWRQYIKISTVGSTVYYDEGNRKTVP